VAKILKVQSGVMVFARIWHMIGGRRRQPTSAQMFRQAQRLRDEGRFEHAAELVESALLSDPGSVVGHLLAGSLHMTLRETGQARTSFERVVALEPTQPRALLGLARIAIEEGEPATCRELLSRALARYPDFPEARALLEVARGLEASADAKRAAAPSNGIRADRLRLPAESREALFVRRDATLLFAAPRGPRAEAVAASAVKLARIATAMLARAGLGPLRHAVIEGAAETTYLRTDDAALLALAFDSDVKAATAVAHLERVWGSCRSELA
jgi:Tfp pilus assembly protein PilF/predicted regulator of Ras-like GTPase activity (Roadblock/LC7/MglB family)